MNLSRDVSKTYIRQSLTTKLFSQETEQQNAASQAVCADSTVADQKTECAAAPQITAVNSHSASDSVTSENAKDIIEAHEDNGTKSTSISLGAGHKEETEKEAVNVNRSSLPDAEKQPVLDMTPYLGLHFREFINLCYRIMLNREADKTGYESFFQMGKSGASNECTVYLISQSEEFANRYEIKDIKQYRKKYKKYLRRYKIKNTRVIGRIVKLFTIPSQIAAMYNDIDYRSTVLEKRLNDTDYQLGLLLQSQRESSNKLSSEIKAVSAYLEQVNNSVVNVTDIVSRTTAEINNSLVNVTDIVSRTTAEINNSLVNVTDIVSHTTAEINNSLNQIYKQFSANLFNLKHEVREGLFDSSTAIEELTEVCRNYEIILSELKQAMDYLDLKSAEEEKNISDLSKLITELHLKNDGEASALTDISRMITDLHLKTDDASVEMSGIGKLINEIYLKSDDETSALTDISKLITELHLKSDGEASALTDISGLITGLHLKTDDEAVEMSGIGKLINEIYLKSDNEASALTDISELITKLHLKNDEEAKIMTSVSVKSDTLEQSLISCFNRLAMVESDLDKINFNMRKMMKSELNKPLNTDNLYSQNNAFEIKLSQEQASDKTSDSNSDSNYSDYYHSVDYFDFENHFRGSRTEIKERDEEYIPYFDNCEHVIDIGCGRGEFLELLKEKGIQATGVDICEDFVDYCIDLGLNVVHGDGIKYLSQIESTDGIFACQIAEHLTSNQIIELIDVSYQKLTEGGHLVIETPNPRSLYIYYNAFYIDPSHIHPVHPMTLEYLMKRAGFKDIKVIETNRSKPNISIPAIEGHEQFNAVMREIDKMLFSSQDYAIIAKK